MQHHQHTAATAAAGSCGDCDGFPVVSIAVSKRAADGSRRTLRVVCRTCNGTGRATATPAARVVVLAGTAA
jgi:DnaJ-class molecular chaperone